MKLLLDTHAILWWLDDDPRLGPDARDVIVQGENELVTSVASLWEIAIKHSTGKLRATAALVAGRLPEASIGLLPIEIAHLTTMEQLPMIHRDPFDRLLVAQALAEPATIMTNDPLIRQYGVTCLGTD